MSWYKANRQLLLQTAKEAIRQGLDNGRVLPLNSEDYPEPCQEHRATFVTLTKNQQLRGCIGSLEAERALIVDIAKNACAAANKDPRFPPVQVSEFEQLKIQVSILSPSTALSFNSESDLLKQIRPGIDGLILEYNLKRGTFLPSVWAQLPTAKEFLRHLKQKAGLNPNFWSEQITVYRYTTESIE
jgi:AmmeMemoRadiSam system protein A